MPTQSCRGLDPRSFVIIQPLPSPPLGGLKIQARSLTSELGVYNPCEPSREQIFRENYRRRQRQLSQQGYRSVSWKPYQEIGAPLYLETKKLILHSLGQLDQPPALQDITDETHGTAEEKLEEVKLPVSPDVSKDDKLFPGKLLRLTHESRELRTIRKDLVHTRQLMSAVRRGAGYFKCLKKEEEEKEGELLAARRRREEQRRAAWNPPKPSSDEESEGEQSDPENFFKTEPASFEVTGQGSETGRWSSRRKRVVPTRPFTPIHCSLLSTRLTERDAETLFRQLCVLIWLLETLTVEPPNATGSVLTCWSGRDPGGTKSSTKRINKDKAIETKWEQFVMQSKGKKLGHRTPRRTSFHLRKTSFGSASRISLMSSNQTLVPDSASSLMTSSDELAAGTSGLNLVCETQEEESATNGSVSHNRQEREDEEPVTDYLRKLLESVHQSIAKELHGEEGAERKNCKESSAAAPRSEQRCGWTDRSVEQQQQQQQQQQPGVCQPAQRPRSSPTHPFSNAGRFSASKSRFSADLQSKFVEVAEEAVLSLHDSLACLERKRLDSGRSKLNALDQPRSPHTYAQDLCRLAEEPGPDQVQGRAETWFSGLLSRIPEGLKENPQISRALRRLSKLGDRQDLRVRSQHFLRVLSGLRDWELCSPYVSSAIEFTRDKVVQMSAEDYDSWLQLRVDIAKRCPSAPPPMR
ncbi:coiled-coil domain-containing protein 60 isoform X1 [Callorhinchus milii]|uniref:coiled-coil domain-containing protein 60 isoform X1 n=1 Tax=Callorhinchus milii TaxID=7868 RepID=UPI001C3F8C03|nr:coiled-coil domain-containing protein 60 isoform X1 [Callorhinchus milii]XP_042193463.1 coiled-coil domain-containing protein 60 isoform X1 [Callorhinchus milii]